MRIAIFTIFAKKIEQGIEMLKVCKFGGSSVASAEQFRKIKGIIESDASRQVVVVSAPGKRTPEETKLTDLFYAVYDLAKRQVNFDAPWELICERYAEIAAELGLKTDVSPDLAEIKEFLTSKPSEITVDYVVSRGEYLSARLMAEFLGFRFVDAFDLIEVDVHFRVPQAGLDKIRELILEGEQVVVPGFYAKNHKGQLRTFSRGGSDITGSILANALDAAMYENWTDVSGLLMADPRIVEGPAPMESVSYREIRELAYSGANVFHDDAIAPCKVKSIPINIKNTNRPEDPGTIIGPVPEQPLRVVTGIAGRKNFSMIYIEKNMMNKERGIGRKALGILEGHNVSYEHSPTGIDSMSIVVDQSHLEEVEELVVEEFQRQLEPDEVTIHKGLALIATVGHGMSHRIGVAATLFKQLAENEINIRIIDQGSSEVNIIVGVDEADYEKAIKSIYAGFAGASL